MNSVLILGLGYVGMTLAIHCARKNIKVYGIEINKDILSHVENKKCHFHEPKIDSYLAEHLGKNFFVSDIISENAGASEVVIISVGTPLSDLNKQPNLKYLDNVLNSLLPFWTEDKLIVLRSTVPVGTSQAISSSLELKLGFKPMIAFCPERTAEGQALKELELLPQIISGNTPAAIKKANEFFSKLAEETVLVDSLEAAELIKLFNNTFRDSMFALANNFNLIAQNFGLNGQDLIEVTNYKYERSYIPSPGFVAGPCLEKDAFILASNVPDESLKKEIEGSRRINIGLEEKFSKKITEAIKNSNASKIIVTGLAFKGRPATNDLRGSSGVNILNSLKEFSDEIQIHDFMNSAEKLKLALASFRTMDQEEIWDLKNFECDMLIILNNNENYKSKKFSGLVDYLIDGGTMIYDCWHVMERNDTFTLGNMFIVKDDA